MLPLWDTQPHRRVPVLTALLICACLGTFGYEVALLLRSEAGFSAWLMTHALVPARLIAGWSSGDQWRTVATHIFLHGGILHVLGNCWFLWVFGNNVEDRLGVLGFALFFAVSGVAAAGVQILVDTGSSLPMIGASGAISGILGAYWIFFPRAWVISLVPWVVPVLPVPALLFLPFWFLMQAYAGIGSLVSGTAGGGGVAWWAHAGGFVAGVTLALFWPRQKRR